jgi:ubiquitin carboxyl-terminal hydrolase 5/13
MDQLPLVDEVCPHAFDDLTFKIPRHTDKVGNQECAYCCATSLHPGGIFVCSKCFVGCCPQHIEKHMQLEASHTTYIRIESSIPYPEKEPEITDASQVGAVLQKQNNVTCFCGECGIAYKFAPDFEIAASASAKAIANADAPTNDAQQDAASAWGADKPCEHCSAALPQVACERFGPGKAIPNESSKCNSCDCSKNCWLCLTCGHVGCPRKEAGGNEHGVFHFMMTGHPLVVKLGTVTPVRADIHCYKCDSEASNYPEFAKHLAHFGIQQQTAVKTAKSLAEMEVDRSLKHEYDSVQEAGVKLVPLFGPGLTGLTNFGNSCYIASILQVLNATTPFVSAFANANHIAGCKRSQPLNCFECQAERLFTGIASGRFSVPPPSLGGDAAEESYRQKKVREDLNGIVPRLWKQIVAGNNADFKGKEQQDAEEYFSWVMNQIGEMKSLSAAAAVDQQKQQHPGKLFEYLEETRRCCSNCKAARYSYTQLQTLQMVLPIENPAPPLDPNAKLTDEEMEARRAPVDFSDMTRKYLEEETFAATCSHCKTKATMTTTRRLATFPNFIAICARREFYDFKLNQVRKLEAKVTMPTELDLSPFVGPGFQNENETWMSETTVSKKQKSTTSNNSSSTAAATSTFKVDESQLENLVAMDFPRDQCRWALFKCKNDPELAVAYIFDHPSEPTESDLRSMEHAPVTPPAPAPPSENNSNDNRLASEDEQETTDRPLFAPKNSVGTDGAPSGYELYAMVSHMGRNAHSGHWIAHVKHPIHGWVIFNDEKVAISQKTPFTHGSIYFYKRK